MYEPLWLLVGSEDSAVGGAFERFLACRSVDCSRNLALEGDLADYANAFQTERSGG